jgi:hypothetical protein
MPLWLKDGFQPVILQSCDIQLVGVINCVFQLTRFSTYDGFIGL